MSIVADEKTIRMQEKIKKDCYSFVILKLMSDLIIDSTLSSGIINLDNSISSILENRIPLVVPIVIIAK